MSQTTLQKSTRFFNNPTEQEKTVFVKLEISLKTLKRLITNHNLVMEDVRHLNPQTKELAKQVMLESFKNSAC